MSLAFIPPASAMIGDHQTGFTKTQMVEAILELNGTAEREWLMTFDFPELRGYWQRLQHAGAPRGNAWDGSSAA